MAANNFKKQAADSNVEPLPAAAPGNWALQALAKAEKPHQVVCTTPKARRATAASEAPRIVWMCRNSESATSAFRQGQATTSKPLLANIWGVSGAVS